METQKQIEEERTKRLQERDDLTTPHTLENIEETVAPGSYADLEEIEPHTQELAVIVEKMKEDLVNETKLLEGTEIPTYESILKNELSEEKKDKQ
jgi:hypothetical protein